MVEQASREAVKYGEQGPEGHWEGCQLHLGVFHVALHPQAAEGRHAVWIIESAVKVSCLGKQMKS